MNPLILQPILHFTHTLVRQAFAQAPKDVPRFAIDVTVGNGHDTVFLAEHVGSKGCVVGCDVQTQALYTTTAVLQQKKISSRVQLHQISHDCLHTLLDPSWQGQVTAIMGNLGYLPRSDKSILTRAETTIPMIETLLPYLRQHGIMAMVAYLGHEGGQAEADAVNDYVKRLPMAEYRVLSYTFVNPSGVPPVLYAIEKV
ncbi:class I SAM-dependent methyltransferase [Fodinisporobacter ferrooxydans]|uniref:Class I SAM-dependent methyltransferase n=1 Tax=Fodinisporobacter ferrooxydans TaxID=2901836 RepID=A0ABY4CHK3_9BACL|nr:class I SAM-dependent methyltransferase [Alicyclobacillaceae bacterium MYW30-H2]